MLAASAPRLCRRFRTAALAVTAAAAPAQDAVDFARDVRPILSDRCYTCHGPDAAARKGELRLDVLAAALAPLPSGRTAIVPGEPARSELWRRVSAPDPGDRMPPADSGRALTAAERDVLRRWIAQGAPHERHWSFEPLPAHVPVPAVSRADWPLNPIDAFVLARLEAEGLAPSPPAAAGPLLRRLGLGLTGLPPTEAELDAFERDVAGDPTAVARAVDRLLASPRYGERMASEWLDVARYADTYGYQSDVDRPVWPWRDWVVRAANDDLPFDAFATRQIAGDLLPGATRDDVLATAFNRLHRQTNEGGSVEEEMRLEYVADRTQTFATAFLGLTMECARCHDHKFDPVSQRDYYALSAFFANIDESGLYSHFTRATPTPALALPNEDQAQAEAAAADRLAALEHATMGLAAAREEAFTRWLAARPEVVVRGATGRFAFDELADGALRNDADPERPGRVIDGPQPIDGAVGRALAFDGESHARLPGIADFDRHQPFTIAFWLRVPQRYDRAVVLHRSRAWTDAGSRGYELLVEDGRLSFALVHFWPGNAVRIRAERELALDRWQHVAVTYDGSSRARGMAIHVDGRRVGAAVVRDGLTRGITGGGADALTLAARFRDRGLTGGAIDELAVFAHELTAPEVAALGPPPRSPSRDELRAYYLAAVDPDYRAHLAELRAARLQLGRLRDSQDEIMVMRELPEPRPTFVRPRGSYLARGDRVTPDTPAALPPLPAGARRDRLALARWLLRPDHPLTARVAVNRIWQMHFGAGLVETAEDFGSQGSPPSHPALLDWLARRFVDSGWSVKALHRLIVTSATYRQSSAAATALRTRDPDNRLLARGPRLSLPAEAVRDQALWAGGLLVERLGGPPVKPYQPPGLWREKSGIVYEPDSGDGLYRRSLYTFWKRTSPPPSMMILDASKRDTCAMRRQRTVTPLQALVLLNDPQLVEAARVWAERLLHADLTDAARAARAFRRLTARSPDPRERDVLARALAEQRAAFVAAPARAAELIAVGARPCDATLPAAEVAAWTVVLGMLFNLDEVVRPR